MLRVQQKCLLSSAKHKKCLSSSAISTLIDDAQEASPTPFPEVNRVASANSKPSCVPWKDAKPYSELPGPRPLPLLGNTWRFLVGNMKRKDSLAVQRYLYDAYGKICVLRGVLGRPDTVFMFDPSLVHEMYINESNWPIRDILGVITHYRKVMRKDLFKDALGLPVSQGQEWFKIRTAVNPILMQPRISEEFIPKIEVAAREFVSRMERLAANDPQMPDDFINEINKYTLESVSYVAINRRFGLMNDELTDETKKIITSTMRVFELIYELDMRPSVWKYVATPLWREFISHMDFLTDVYMNLIDEEITKQMRRTTFSSDEDKSILQKFLAVDKKIAITVVFDSLAAGVDTTSKTLGAILYLLAKHKRAQNKLRKELMEVIPDIEQPITPEVINKCKYLRAVIKESARLHGVSLGNIRTAEKDMVLGGYRIPKGVEIFGGNAIMCNSDEWIPRAREFLPERHLRDCEDAISMKNCNKYLFLPFGFGPRSCVGKRIANLELEISVAMVIRKFRLEWNQPDMTFRATIMYGLTGPLKLHVYPLEPGAEIDPSIDLDRLDYAPEASV